MSSVSFQFLRPISIGLCASAIMSLVACGGGSSSSTPATITYTTINSSTPSTNYTSLTGIRGVTGSTDVYITGGAISSTNPSVYSNQLYKGPTTGGGAFYTLTPRGSGQTANAYSVDNWNGNQVKVVGSYLPNGTGSTNAGFLYQGPVETNNMSGSISMNAAPWYGITYKKNGTTYSSIPHSVMNNIVVGGFKMWL